jgi:hypothetical protein
MMSTKFITALIYHGHELSGLIYADFSTEICGGNDELESI